MSIASSSSRPKVMDTAESSEPLVPASAPPRLGTTSAGAGSAAMPDASSISSPHELTDWVDNLLDTLQTRFGTMSEQVESRMREMSTRIDALESSIEELIHGALAPIPSSTTAGSLAKEE